MIGHSEGLYGTYTRTVSFQSLSRLAQGPDGESCRYTEVNRNCLEFLLSRSKDSQQPRAKAPGLVSQPERHRIGTTQVLTRPRN
jgi:hypothetical protein